MSSQRALNTLKLFSMRNLLLEADLEKIEKSGIAIDHIKTVQKDDLVDIDLFDSEILTQARKMANFYVLYYSLENSVRTLISERLKEEHGADWWNKKVPDGVKDNVKKKQDDEKDSVMAIRSEDPLSYTNFGELIPILDANWDDFSDIIRSKKSMQDTLSAFNKVRNVIAHSCELTSDDVMRFELLIKDWLRIQM